VTRIQKKYMQLNYMKKSMTFRLLSWSWNGNIVWTTIPKCKIFDLTKNCAWLKENWS
jgi:hypothetical protein